MRKKIIKALLFILIMAIVPSVATVKATDASLEIVIEGSFEKVTEKTTRQYSLNIKKVKNDNFADIMKKYQQVKTIFDRDYQQKRKLVVESSTVKQAYEHSFTLLKTCMYYINEYNDLQDFALLQLLVGPWEGKAKLVSKEKTDKKNISISRVLNIIFESNQAGMISKGLANGTETVKESLLVKEDLAKPASAFNQETRQDTNTNNQDNSVVKIVENKKVAQVKGSITGNIISKGNSSFTITIDTDNPLIDDKFKTYDIKAKTMVLMPPFVKRTATDEAFTLTVSNLKMYYDYLFKSKRSPNELLNDKYNWFFVDLLDILNILAYGHVSREVYKSLKVYPGSEYVSYAFKDYINTLNSYYNKLFLRSDSKKYKLDIYKLYLLDLIQLSSLAHLNIVNPEVLQDTNLDITKPDNQINKVLDKYIETGKAYYTNEIKTTNGEEEQLFRDEYKAFLNEIYQLSKTGIIQENIIKKFTIDKDFVESVNNI